MSTVFLYASYCCGKFFPQISGSSVSSVSSTTRKNGLAASCLWPRMFIRRATRPKATMKAPTATRPRESGERPRRVALSCELMTVSLQLGRVPDVAVAPDTRQRFLLAVIDLVHDVLVAVPARPFRHAAVVLGDLNRLVKLAGGELERVIETVACFDEELLD